MDEVVVQLFKESVMGGLLVLIVVWLLRFLDKVSNTLDSINTTMVSMNGELTDMNRRLEDVEKELWVGRQTAGRGSETKY